MVSEVSVAGGVFSVGLWSKGQGSPLLYLHGIQGHPGDAPFLLRLAESHQVIAPVHLGYGASTSIDRVDDILDVIFSYRTLLEDRDTGPVDVVGHSLGGMFAAEFAAFCPHLVRKLVLVDSYGLWLDDDPAPDPFIQPEDQLAKMLYANPESEEAKEADARLWAGLEGDDLAVMKTRNMSAAAKFLWPIPDRGLSRRLRFIKAPALLIWGEQDKLVPPRYAQAFQQGIANAQVTFIPGAGHNPMIEKPDEFVAAVESFLR